MSDPEPAAAEITADARDADPAPQTRGWWIAVAVLVALLPFAVLGGWWIGQSDDEEFNDVDVGFLADMTVHHQGAIALGFAYIPREHDPLVAHEAREIVLLQAQQIGFMNEMLDDAGNPATAADDVAMDWMGSPVAVERMPGLATSAEFAELRGADGLAVDEVFTRLMIRHHAAGVAMARHAAAEGENGRVTALAESMARIQGLEIAEMNRRRVALGLPTVDATDLERGIHDGHG